MNDDWRIRAPEPKPHLSGIVFAILNRLNRNEDVALRITHAYLHPSCGHEILNQLMPTATGPEILPRANGFELRGIHFSNQVGIHPHLIIFERENEDLRTQHAISTHPLRCFDHDDCWSDLEMSRTCLLRFLRSTEPMIDARLMRDRTRGNRW